MYVPLEVLRAAARFSARSGDHAHHVVHVWNDAEGNLGRVIAVDENKTKLLGVSWSLEQIDALGDQFAGSAMIADDGVRRNEAVCLHAGEINPAFDRLRSGGTAKPGELIVSLLKHEKVGYQLEVSERSAAVSGLNYAEWRKRNPSPSSANFEAAWSFLDTSLREHDQGTFYAGGLGAMGGAIRDLWPASVSQTLSVKMACQRKPVSLFFADFAASPLRSGLEVAVNMAFAGVKAS